MITSYTPSSPLSLPPSLLPLVIVRKHPESQGVLFGGSVNITCVIEAGYNVTIQWFKDDVIYDGQVSTNKSGNLCSSTLSINNAAFEDCGGYTCYAAFDDDMSVSVNSSTAYLGVVSKLVTLSSTHPHPYVLSLQS